jgi:hypothetical protein
VVAEVRVADRVLRAGQSGRLLQVPRPLRLLDRAAGLRAEAAAVPVAAVVGRTERSIFVLLDVEVEGRPQILGPSLFMSESTRSLNSL